MNFYSDNLIKSYFARFNTFILLFSSFISLTILTLFLLISTFSGVSLLAVINNQNLLIIFVLLSVFLITILFLISKLLFSNPKKLAKIEYYLDEKNIIYMFSIIFLISFFILIYSLYFNHLNNLFPSPGLLDLILPYGFIFISFFLVIFSLLSQIIEVITNQKKRINFHNLTVRFDLLKSSFISYIEHYDNKSIFFEIQNVNKINSIIDKSQNQNTDYLINLFKFIDAKTKAKVKQIKIVKLPFFNPSSTRLENQKIIRIFIQVIFANDKYNKIKAIEVQDFQDRALKQLNADGFSISILDGAISSLVFISQFHNNISVELLNEIASLSNKLRHLNYESIERSESLEPNLNKISERLSKIVDIRIMNSSSEHLKLQIDNEEPTLCSIVSLLEHDPSIQYPYYDKLQDTLIYELNPIDDFRYDFSKHRQTYKRLIKNFKKSSHHYVDFLEEKRKKYKEYFSNRGEYNKRTDNIYSIIKNNPSEFLKLRKYIVKKADHGNLISINKNNEIPSFFGSNHYGEQINILTEIISCQHDFSFYEPLTSVLPKNQVKLYFFDIFTEDNLYEPKFVSSMPLGYTLNLENKSERYPAFLDLATYRYKVPNKDRLNPHTILLGKSGSGKSTLIKQMIISRAKQVKKIIVFDVKQGEFAEPLNYLMKLQNNPYSKKDIVFKNSEIVKLRINPFAIYGDYTKMT